MPILVRVDRYIQVKVGHDVSDKYKIENGTPQGSSISPILFLIMINDIEISDPTIKLSLFADDTAIWKCGKNTKFLNTSIQKAIDEIQIWADKWGFKFFPVKTVAVLFSKGRKEDIQLKMYGQSIKVSEKVKYLGMYFDSKLSWRPHIQYLIDKCNKRINVMKCLTGTTWGGGKDSLLVIYKALILSVLDYGCQLYDSASPTVKKRLDIVQNQALRICCGALK